MVAGKLMGVGQENRGKEGKQQKSLGNKNKK